jgi:mannose-6-phosphate isomerase
LTNVAALTRHTGAHVAGLVEVLPEDAASFFRMELLTPGAARFAVAAVLSGAGALTAVHSEPVDVERGRPGTTWPPHRPTATEQGGTA